MRTRYQPKETKTRRGFTLIELLVVVSITLLLSGILLTYNGIGRDQVTLYTESAKVIQTILRSRSFAVTAYLNTTDYICGYGLHVISNTPTFEFIRYTRKVDGSGNPDPNFTCEDIGDPTKVTSLKGQYDPKVEQQYTLVQGVQFAQPEADYILFRPPDPKIFFYANNAAMPKTMTSVKIFLRSQTGSRVEITVGQGGQVSYRFL